MQKLTDEDTELCEFSEENKEYVFHKTKESARTISRVQYNKIDRNKLQY